MNKQTGKPMDQITDEHGRLEEVDCVKSGHISAGGKLEAKCGIK